MNFETFLGSFRVLDRKRCAQGHSDIGTLCIWPENCYLNFLNAQCRVQNAPYGTKRIYGTIKNKLFEHHDTDYHFPYFTPSMSDLAIDLKGEIRCWSLDLVQACQKIGPWRCGHISWSGEILSCRQHNIGSRSISNPVNSLSYYYDSSIYLMWLVSNMCWLFSLSVISQQHTARPSSVRTLSSRKAPSITGNQSRQGSSAGRHFVLYNTHLCHI